MREIHSGRESKEVMLFQLRLTASVTAPGELLASVGPWILREKEQYLIKRSVIPPTSLE